MNVFCFFIHTLLIVLFVVVALRAGKETLMAWIALQAVLANFFVLKQIDLFGCTVTCSDVYVIGSVASLNLLQEYHGKESARKAIWISFLSMLFFTLMSQFQLLYLPSARDSAHGAYSTLLTVAPRLFLASMTAFFLTQRADLSLFALLRKRAPMLSLAWRSALSLCVTQLFDTLLFTFLGLYGLGFALFDIILLSYSIKLTLILLFSLPTLILRDRHSHEV